jgi:hypothetical protein
MVRCMYMRGRWCVGDGCVVGDGALYVYAWAMVRGRWWGRGRWCTVVISVGDGV